MRSECQRQRVRSAAKVHSCFCTQAPARKRGPIATGRWANSMNLPTRYLAFDLSMQRIPKRVVEGIVASLRYG